MLGEVGRPRAFEVGARDVEEHQVRLEAEEVSQTMVQSQFDLLLCVNELVQGTVPGIQLRVMDADTPTLVPVGYEAPPQAIADKVGLQPAGQSVFTGRVDEPISDQHEGPVGERRIPSSAQPLVEDLPEAELVEEETG